MITGREQTASFPVFFVEYIFLAFLASIPPQFLSILFIFTRFPALMCKLTEFY